MTHNLSLAKLNKLSEIYQWLADIFACYGSFTDLPEESLWDATDETATRLTHLNNWIQKEESQVGKDLLEQQIATIASSLFEVNQGGIPLPLYGSWWLEGKLQGETTWQVSQVLKEEGLETTVEIADFLPTELEFLSLVLQMEAEGHSRKDESIIQVARSRRQSFTMEFMRPWIIKFKKEADQQVTSPYWSKIIGLLFYLITYDT